MNVVVLLAILMASLTALPVVLAGYREQRILRRIATTPAKPRDLLIAQYGIHGLAAIVGGGLALPQNMIGFLFVLLLMLAACLSIGGLIAGSLRALPGRPNLQPRSARSCSSL